ncbi:15288_t:CDS:1, partial [Cetraspora pellucida]
MDSVLENLSYPLGNQYNAATNEEYNFLIKELIGNAEFPDFTNPK